MLTIIIPHRDDLRGLDRTLASLATGQVGRAPFEVIVVDNDSLAGIATVNRIARRHVLPLRIIREPVVGAGPARNRGVQNASGDRLVFLDCDSEPAPGWLDALDDALTRCDVVGGPVRVCVRDGKTNTATAAELFDLLFGFQSERSFERDGLLLSGNLATSRTVFEQVGPFFVGLSEDRDWCVRATRAGYRLQLLQKAVVRHYGLDREDALKRRWERVTRESFNFHRAQQGSLKRWLVYCVLVAGSIIFHSPKIFVSAKMKGVSLRKRFAVLRLLVAIRFMRATIGARLLFTRDR